MIFYIQEEAAGKEIPYKICPRREGDIAICYADPSKAKRVLGWEATKGIKEMCRDALNWQMKHPYGFDEPPKSEQCYLVANHHVCWKGIFQKYQEEFAFRSICFCYA